VAIGLSKLFPGRHVCIPDGQPTGFNLRHIFITMKAVILLVIHDFVSVNQLRGKLIFGRNSGTKANMVGFDTGSLGTMRAHGSFPAAFNKAIIQITKSCSFNI